MKNLKFLFLVLVFSIFVGVSQVEAQAEIIDLTAELELAGITPDYAYVVDLPTGGFFLIKVKWTIPPGNPLAFIIPEHGNDRVGVLWIYEGVEIIDRNAIIKHTGELIVDWHYNGAGSKIPPEKEE